MRRRRATKPARNLQSILNSILEKNRSGFLESDPLEFVRRYTDPRDQEIASFAAACFAMGKADLIRKAVRTILDGMGESPYDFVQKTDPALLKGKFGGFVYRFFKAEDVAVLLFWIRQALERYGSLERLFLEGYSVRDADIGPALSRFVRKMLRMETRPVVRFLSPNSGLRAYFSNPESGSGCKRLSLFLRWVVRREEPDLGIWKSVSPAKLIIPLDTHVIRLGKKLGLTTRATPDWKMAREITESIRRFEPHDPVKYDFALCHAGMLQPCPADQNKNECRECVFGICCNG